jgi:hypothetical protein
MIRTIGVLGAAAAMLLATVAVQASGAPKLAWSPSTSGSYDYGTLDAWRGRDKLGHVHPQKLGRHGSGTLAIALSGSAAFTETADGYTGRSLGPKKSCGVTVEYAPTANSESDSATLTANGDLDRSRGAIGEPRLTAYARVPTGGSGEILLGLVNAGESNQVAPPTYSPDTTRRSSASHSSGVKPRTVETVAPVLRSTTVVT